MTWKNIHSDFTEELQKEWESKGFNENQVRDWINIGLEPTDYGFARWLRDDKKLTLKQY